MFIRFFEKYDDRLIEGETKEDILSKVLKERIEDTYGALFGSEYDNSNLSVWYDDDTARAKEFLASGKATEYMTSRLRFEYESWEVVPVEVEV